MWRFMKNILEKAPKIKELINNSDYVLIGAGAGLSTAAGIEYYGKRFKENFSEYIEKYNFTDLYTSSFYNFKTEEEKWAYWAKHIYISNISMSATKLYSDILKIVKMKEYFVITTNVDDQFYKSGFNKDRIFATQGSYRYIQCSKACHNKLYDDTNLVKEMIEKTKNCKIPSQLIPICPVCGRSMEVNIRKNEYFVEDDNWKKQYRKYREFLNMAKNKKVVLLEFGVGFNTPSIIRYPFEQLTYENINWNLVRFNKEASGTFLDLEDRIISVKEDINEIVNEILK